jgi:DNA repair protein RadC
MDTCDQLELPASRPAPHPHRHSLFVGEVKVTSVRETPVPYLTVCNRPELVLDFFNRSVAGAAWHDPEKECLIAIMLDRKNRAKDFALISLGTATGSLVHPREVFRPVIAAAATALVLVHNHPSGDPAPSSADLQVTRRLREAAQAVDVQLIDHVIVGTRQGDPAGRGYYSFREAGLL